ncbi:MAG: flagellin [Vampirovibrionales bacterium]|nr:flagellin [Vampirovibrionales bacterium]
MIRLQSSSQANMIQRQIAKSGSAMERSLEKLGSGTRIFRAGDDAAGLTISSNVEAQIRGQKKATENIQDGLKVLDLAESYYGQITNMAQRIRELAVQASNDTNSADSRNAAQAEATQLVNEINRSGAAINFGTVTLSGLANFVLQIGGGSAAATNTLDVGALQKPTAAEGVFQNTAFTGAINLSSNANALASIVVADSEIARFTGARSVLSATSNRLQGTLEQMGSSVENLSAARSRIQDVDVAAESAELTKSQIQSQSAVALMTQNANLQNSIALKLLSEGLR